MDAQGENEPPVIFMTKDELIKFVNTIPETEFENLILEVGRENHGERTERA